MTFLSTFCFITYARTAGGYAAVTKGLMFHVTITRNF